MKQPIVLKVFRGEKLEAVRQFEHSQIVIGRGADSQLELDDESVAPLHAMIEDRDGEYFVSDLGSQTGTFKNGNRVLEDSLSSGDKITVGEFSVQFFIGVPKPAAPPRIIPAAGPSEVSPGANAVRYNEAAKQPVADEPRLPTEAPVEVAPPTPPPITPKKSAGAIPPITRAIPTAAGAAVAATANAAAPAKSDSHAGHKTFAPPNPYASANEIIKPHKGSVVEVLVTWNNKVLSTKTFRQGGSVYMSSSEDADVFVPIISSRSKYELLKISGQITVCLTQEMTGELVRDGETTTFSELARQNKVRNAGTHFELDVRQGEMVRIGLQNELISIYVRYIADAPKPLVAPLLDMSSSEVTGVILAMVVSLILGAYMNIYSPSPLAEDEARQEDKIIKTVVKFTPPPKKETPPEPEKPPEPPKPKPPEPKKVVKVTDAPKQEVKKQVKNVPKSDPGKAAELAPNPNAKPTKKLSTNKTGGSVKTGTHEAANMKSDKPDPTKTGLLGAFGSKGMQKEIDKAYSGSGELQGMAQNATGFAGSAESRDGDSFGNKIKDVGSGKGSSTVGITGGVGTKGRGTGGTGYGSGGLGQKGNSSISIEGSDADVGGGMDKEAIRRVIRENLREIRNCYEKELQRSPDLYGKVVIEWDIEDGGHVTRAVVKSDGTGNKNVGNCIASHLKNWKFPDPPAGQIGRVVYPFVFSSQ